MQLTLQMGNLNPCNDLRRKVYQKLVSAAPQLALAFVSLARGRCLARGAAVTTRGQPLLSNIHAKHS